MTLTLTDIYCAHGYVCEREGERGCEHYYKSDTVRENERKRERESKESRISHTRHILRVTNESETIEPNLKKISTEIAQQEGD